MEFEHDNAGQVVEEDRFSSLPNELIHKILSSFDMKFALQTCLLSSRWKLLWTSIPCLNFSCDYFGNLLTFAKFVIHVLAHCNHQVEVSSVNLHFRREASQVFVRNIANFSFSHNVKELYVFCCPKKYHQSPLCLFNSQTLKHFTLTFPCFSFSTCITPTTPWDFPALTTLHLSQIKLRGDLFSKCVNLKNLTLSDFHVEGLEEAFDIITPRLSNLMLQHGRCSKVMNVIAPQLEKITIDDCSIKSLIAPPGLSSLCYRGDPDPLQLCKDGFHSLSKVSFSLLMHSPFRPYKEEDARKTLKMLHEIHSARFLTLNVDIIECISSFPDLLSHHPSPFGNLRCLTIDSRMRGDDAYKVKMSTEAKKFFFGNSPNATSIMELPKLLLS